MKKIKAESNFAWSIARTLRRARWVVLPLLFISTHLMASWGCAQTRPRPSSGRGRVLVSSVVKAQEPEAGATLAPAASRPKSESEAERLQRLRALIAAVLASPEMIRARTSLLVERAARKPAAPASAPHEPGAAPGDSDPVDKKPAATSRPVREVLVAVEPATRRVPASNAKLLTSAAAVMSLPGRYAFVTEVSRSRAGGPLYLWGTGDPVLRGKDLNRLARQLRSRGVRRVRGIVVDDSYFGRRRLAPGFDRFIAGSYYRPTSSAVNVDGNAIVIRVSAPKRRRRPKVEVLPPSDYVKVNKKVRFARRDKRARRRPRRCKRCKVRVKIRPRGSIMWVTVSGLVARNGRPHVRKRAVYDPALNAGWALRRALIKAGVKVAGVVRRGRRPARSKVLVRKRRSLGTILAAVNRRSDNLAAENLVRAMGILERPGKKKSGTWERGLARMRTVFKELGIEEYWLGNGSGLHRNSWVTAQTMVALLQHVFATERLRRTMVPTLAVAGKSGTLARRMKGTEAAGFVAAKTGTLGGALALSGYVDPAGPRPLVFSILVNGRSDRKVRDQIDRIATLLARYARGAPLDESAGEPASLPSSMPTSAPSSRPAEVTAGAPDGSARRLALQVPGISASMVPW